MNGMESSPIEIVRTSSAPLELDADERLNLHQELRDLSSELSETLTVVPFSTLTEYSDIKLDRSSETPSGKGLSFRIKSETNEVPITQISLTGDGTREREQRVYAHRPSFNVWEELRPGLSEPYRLLDNASLVNALAERLPGGIFDSISDINPDGATIAFLLATYLQDKARSRVEEFRYRSPGVAIGDGEFTRDTDFVVKRKNERVIRGLFVAASQYVADYGSIRKVYGYQTIDQNGVLESAGGKLELTARDRVTQARLNAYAQSDARDNDAVLGIQNGIDDIRKAYGLTQQIS